MKKVIIHIGQYKTGSTSIQKLLWESRSELLKNGILYPESFTRDCAHFLVSDMLRIEYRNKDFYTDLVPLREEIENSSAGVAVISCESLSGATVRRFAPDMMMYMWRRLADLFEGYDVRIVFYVRRQDESIDSRIIQEIKGQARKSTISYESFLSESSALNYHFFYSLLEEVFGSGTVDARLYDRKSVFKSDIRYDFLHYLGLPLGAISVPASEDNVSPSAKLVGFYRVINTLNLSADDYSTLNTGVWRELSASGGPKAVVLGSRERNEIMEYFSKSNEDFVSEYVREESKEGFSDALFGPVRGVEANVFIDGVDVWRILKNKGFDVVRAL